VLESVMIKKFHQLTLLGLPLFVADLGIKRIFQLLTIQKKNQPHHISNLTENVCIQLSIMYLCVGQIVKK